MGTPSSVPVPAGAAPRGLFAGSGMRHAVTALGAFALLARGRLVRPQVADLPA